MECSCMTCNDADPCEFSTGRWVKARKPHICCECEEKINKGERSHVISGMHDRRFFKHYTCVVCAKMRDQLYCNGYVIGEMRQDLWYELGVDYVDGRIRE